MGVMQSETDQVKKKRILRISYIFVGIMLFLTFFSNTINNFSLPRVSTGQPVGGSLIKEVTGSSSVQARETLKVYSKQGRLVTEVRVKLGDKVKKGQAVVVLDKAEIERQLEEEMLRYDQMKLNLEKLNDIESGIGPAEKALEAAKENLKDVGALYDSGAISKGEFSRAEDAVFQAEKDLEDVKRKQRDNERDIKIQQDNIKLEELTINKLKKALGEESTLVSPVDGIVGELNATPGSLVSGESPVFSIADTSKGFEVRIDVNLEKAQYLAVGDAVEITVKSLGANSLAGTISGIAESAKSRGELKEVTIDIPSDEISGGELCDIYINKKSNAYNILVPNAAVGTDATGRFVWVLKERKGSLGSEFYVRKAAVTIEDSDSSKTAVINGISPEEQIVVSHSKNLSDGDRVLPDK
ncbi:MAG TPA: efflux RND transporter periplasmic adaptor subunit [Clostridia bacterium]|nr:efflux RND transporter periplasmic adaptor subunit [Clostridia bacterium]